MEPTHLAPTIKVPGVELGAFLGNGAFGSVHKARHLTLDIEVAVKFINIDANNPSTVERALGEARLMVRLDHPNLLRIHDAGRVGSVIYLVLEFMDGSCSPLRRVESARALDLCRQLLSGLQALHDARVLHRDIKPANCLVRKRDGRVKLADLGIAVQQGTKTDGVFDAAGTLPFMAPELFENPSRYGPASDLYALGITLACMSLDKNPFPDGSFAEIYAWIKEGPRPSVQALRPDLPVELSSLIDRLMSRRIQDRPSSAAEALTQLSRTTLAVFNAEKDLGLYGMIGPWMLGSQLFASHNWAGYAVTHSLTGTPARLTQMQPKASFARSADLILASAQRVSQLDHPGIIDIIDWGKEDGLPYIVTATRGRSLEDLIESGGPCNELQALEFSFHLADGLAHLHKHGLVYQVLDPPSVAMTPDGLSTQLAWPVFCIPASTPVQSPEGKPQRALVELYAAPESVSFDCTTIEPAIDVYALGAVFYYMLTGKTAAVEDAVMMVVSKGQAPDVRSVVAAITAPTATLISEMMNPVATQRPAGAEVKSRIVRILKRMRGMNWHTPAVNMTTETIDETILT